MLINHGIPVSQPHKDGYLPFHRACWGKDSRHTETVKVFLDAGVAVNVPAENGKTCLDMTQNKATKKLLKKYMKNAEL